MVTRVSEAFQVAATPAPQVQGSSAGVAQVDQQAIRRDSEPSAMAMVASQLFGEVAKLDLAHDDLQRQEAYVQGAEAASAGLAESEIQADPMTRDWATAGWRDTTGKLAVSSFAADVAANMNRYREMSPEQFGEMLSNQRKQFTPTIRGMSREARASMVNQLGTTIASLSTKHASEHAKFIVDQKTAALQAGVSVAIDGMNAAKDDLNAYSLATTNAVNTLHTMVVQDPSIPAELKGKLIQEALTYALSTDNLTMYELARNTDVPLPGGRTGKLTELIPLDKQTSLAAAYREAGNRTATLRNMQLLSQIGEMEAGFGETSVELPTPEDFWSMVQLGVQAKVLGSDKVRSLTKAYHAAVIERDTLGIAAADYAAGNVQALASRGITMEQARKQFETTYLSRGGTLAGLTMEYIHQGRYNGTQESYARAGELLIPALASAGEGADMTASNAELLVNAFEALEQAEDAGSAGASEAVLSRLPEELRAKAVRMRESMRTQGITPQQAAATAQQRALEDANMSPELRKARYAQQAKDSLDIVREVTDAPLGTFGYPFGAIGAAVGDLVSRDKYRTAERELRPWGGLPGKGFLANEYAENQRLALRNNLMETLSAIDTAHPTLNKGQKRAMAMADILSRTIPTDVGPLTLRRGVTLNEFFGVPANVGRERIGEALSGLVKSVAPDAAAVEWFTDPDGSISFRPTDNGKPLPGLSRVYVDKSAVQAQLDLAYDRAAAKGSKLVSRGTRAGTPFTEGGLGTLRYDGENTSGVTLDLMHKFRSALVKQEDVRQEVYKDRTGVLTVSAGVSAKNDFFPRGLKKGDRIGERDASDIFAKASDWAMNEALKISGRTGRSTDSWLLLTAESVYQAGPGGAYDADARAVYSARTYAEAEAAFKKTRMWAYSGAKRHSHYLRLLQAAFKEG